MTKFLNQLFTFLCVAELYIFITVSYISKSKERIIEGQLRVHKLVEYLERLKLPKKVWICEDASGIIANVKYDPSSNQLVGNVLPLDSTTGMPVSFSFLAKSAEEIREHSTKPLSTLVYMVLTLPLMPNLPPFVLQVYGTGNKFSAEDVKHRSIFSEFFYLFRNYIEVIGFSSDGDTRLLSSMLHFTKQNESSGDFVFFCLQDTVHIEQNCVIAC